jgi:hypothetical protein
LRPYSSASSKKDIWVTHEALLGWAPVTKVDAGRLSRRRLSKVQSGGGVFNVVDPS